MTEQKFYINSGTEKIVNLDTDQFGNYIVITNQNTILTNEYTIKIDGDVKYSIIRKLNNDFFLLTHSQTNGFNNASIFNFNSQLISSFNLDNGIKDVLIQQDKIIISYFDRWVLAGKGASGAGVAVFDFNGQQLFGFNSSAIYGKITECYCMCKHGTNRVLLYIYSNMKFHLVELNIDTMQIEIFETPTEFDGASAIVSNTKNIYFHSLFKHTYGLFLYDKLNNKVKRYGEYPSFLKGIKNGVFNSFDDNGFTLVDIKE
ncbi:hypothetical protein [Emticicia sp. C21]|uniref:hypothetical protein n=1 Tax=Emticicia sp. C21 TaxID=2302915 RepID=UPI000E354295|nr:hypothetical protein [Emticicia sp. C21]RFS15876.1 hypothetical protein D0T08_13290 [Emticicia sp. C21]